MRHITSGNAFHRILPLVLSLTLLVTMPVLAESNHVDGQYVIFMGDTGVIVLRFEVSIANKSPRQVFEGYVDDLMKSIDVNGDGVVTIEEARGRYLTHRDALSAQLISQTDAAPREINPDVSPADEQISRSEFLSYFRRIGLQPFIVQFQPYVPQPGMQRQPRQSMATTDVPLFARLDSNRDGKLSSQELAATLQILHKLDLDDDETISLAELNPLSNQAINQPPPANNSRSVYSSPFLALGSDESITKQIRRLIEKYDSIDPVKSEVAGTKVRNQKLSASELGIAPDVFIRFDSDSDGQLDIDELRQFLTSPEPMISIAIELDSLVPLKAESLTQQLAADKLRMSPDGAINVNLGSTQFSIGRGSILNSQNAELLLKPLFLAADLDANGYLEKSEMERAISIGVTFEDLDADKNGKVYFEEVIAYFQDRLNAAQSRTILSIQEQGRTLFDILDTDRDRRLSFRELTVAADKLALWDKDGDGLLSESEIPLQYRLIVSRGSLPAFTGNFSVAGMNQDGAPKETASGPIWFRKMDRNRDGEISKREFLGDPTVFEKFDRNHDGFIDLNEAVQMHIQ